MAKIYYTRMLTGTITFAQVPARYKSQVKALGIADVESGKMPVYQYIELFGSEYPN